VYKVGRGEVKFETDATQRILSYDVFPDTRCSRKHQSYCSLLVKKEACGITLYRENILDCLSYDKIRCVWYLSKVISERAVKMSVCIGEGAEGLAM